MRTRVVFLELLSGRPLYVDPSNVALASIESLEPTEEAAGFPGCKFELTDDPGVPVYVRGRREVVFADIVAGQANGVDSVQFVPLMASSGAGVLAVQGGFRALRIGQMVFVSGQFDFTPAANLVAETVSIALPSTMQPAANFAATTDAAGLADMTGVRAVTEGDGTVLATVAAKTVSVVITQVAGTKRHAVSFSYRVS